MKPIKHRLKGRVFPFLVPCSFVAAHNCDPKPFVPESRCHGHHAARRTRVPSVPLTSSLTVMVGAALLAQDDTAARITAGRGAVEGQD